MAESRGQGPRRGDTPRGAGQSGRPGAAGGAGGRGGSSRGGAAAGGRSGAPRRGDGARGPAGQGGRPPRDDRRTDRRDDRDDRRIRPRDEAERSAEQAKYDGPPLDPEISGKELDRNVAQQLRGLPEKLAARVARHLVAAGMLLDEDPKTAYQHTLAARARAARIAVVREACGEAAYYAGEYAEALSELRAAKRMNGNTEYLPVMADCERALGRPEKALALARNPSVANLEDSLKAEMTIVEAGARRDLGELDAALRTLENAPLRSRSRADWVARLRYAYADTLLAAGKREEAVIWFHRTVGVDSNEVTDAAERLEQLES
ncbi:MAG: tetratricopeptide repeat protein [Nocardioides sp.]